jgi:hypothetical protein
MAGTPRRSRQPTSSSSKSRRGKSSEPSKPSTQKPCKDCGSTTRKSTYPGPRCYTCHHKKRKGTSDQRRLTYVAKQYNLTPEQYEALRSQLRRNDRGQYICPLCDRNQARCVDHDHKCCPGKISCGKCVRGLICSPCNKFLGHLRDDPEALLRFGRYLSDYNQRRNSAP